MSAPYRLYYTGSDKRLIFLGKEGSGRTKLLSALADLLAYRRIKFAAETFPYEYFNSPLSYELDCGFVQRVTTYSYIQKSNLQRIVIDDFDSPEDVLKGLLHPVIPYQGAVLVLRGTDTIDSELKRQLCAAFFTGIRHLAVFVNSERTDIPGGFSALRKSVSDILRAIGFPENRVSFFIGSVTDGMAYEPALNTVLFDLITFFEKDIPTHTEADRNVFRMTIEQSYTARDYVYVVGHARKGTPAPGMEVEVSGLFPMTLRTRIVDCKPFPAEKQVQAVTRGMQVALQFEKPARPESLSKGRMLASPDTFRARTKYRAVIYSLKEGRLPVALPHDFDTVIHLNSSDTPVHLVLPDTRDTAKPGMLLNCTLEATVPLPVDAGETFLLTDTFSGIAYAAGVIVTGL